MTRPLLIAFAALAAALPALAEEPRPAGPKPPAAPSAPPPPPKAAVRVGDSVDDIATKDLDGAEWRLSTARTVTEEAALAAARAAAAELGGAADLKAEAALDELPGLKEDPAKRAEFAKALGKPFGLFASDEVAGGWKTLGDAAGWVRTGAAAPVVLMWWSPKCPTSAKYEERIVEILQKTGARLFPVATNFADDDASIRAYLQGKGIPYRVLIDREAVLADRFGAKRTPHVFVFDAKGTLRYSGAVDDDKEEGRADWLLSALEAIADGGRPVEVLMTEPKG